MLLLIIITILWLLSALADYGQFCYVWQLKEYRLDRFKDFLGTILGKKFIFSYKVIIRPVLFCLLILTGFKIILALIIVFSLDLLDSFIKLARGRFNRPKPTAKAFLIIASAAIIEGLILLAANKYPLILILAVSRFIIISLSVLIINLPAKLVKKYYYKQAAKKIAGYKNLIVIGVTGSYGKTTVKNFLEQTLSAKFKTIKTPKNINTELGIAKFILNTDFSQTDIFVAEMGAYKIGEIKIICDIVKPRLGILTAINEQHLPLFGNIENTQTAKFELLRSLPADGLAIVNSDNQYCREFMPGLKCQVKTFGQLAEFKPDCLISNISGGTAKLEFKAAPDYRIKTNIIGSHNAMNIAPVILAAGHLKFTKNEIEQRAGWLKLPEATMQIVNYGSSTVIDDSYNASPESFIAALKFLADYKVSGLPADKAGKKIVISRGMIELGQASQKAHEKIGKLIAETADEFIIISPDSVLALKTGAGGSALKITTIFEPAKLFEYIKESRNQSNIILLEGRIPDIIKNEIYK